MLVQLETPKQTIDRLNNFIKEMTEDVLALEKNTLYGVFKGGD